MKKRLLTIAVAALFFAVSNAQQTYHRCSSMEYLEAQKLADPTLITRLQEIEEHTQQYAQNNGGGERAVVTIPVVFHVVYNTSAQNISDALINAQLAQLNADYARLNSDAGSTPSAFAGLGANTNIQFCLAKRDPSGNATTGIVRKSTTVTSWSTNDAVKKSSSGGDDAWPASSYLNIWVCNLGSGLLGYAQFPGGSASTDGVVLLYSSVGSLTTPGTASPYNYGRTATHEVGHWLNLYHIWGDDNTSCTGTDNVSDTPNQADENYGCPSFPTVSCTNGPNGDMFMNYMDYTDDGCMNLFTQGQSTRMNALFGTGGSRIGLLSSLGCQAPSGGGTTCAVATGLSTSSITTSSATISWTAVSGAVSYNVQFRAVGGSTWTSGNVTSTSASLTGLSAATNYEWQVQTVCASGSSAFSASATFTTLSGSTCSDNYESNNTASAAKTAPLNSNFNGLITPSTDVDWFKIVTTSSATRVKVDLTTLPADYDMVLYKSNGSTKLATSANGGTTSETLKYNATSAGTYYLKVYGYNGATSATSCYTLKVSTSASNFRTDGSNDGAIEAMEVTAEPALKVFPNPASDKLNAEFVSNTAGVVTFAVYNLSGQRVLTTVSEATEGYNTQSINTATLSNGVYVLEITTNGETQRQKFSIGK